MVAEVGAPERGDVGQPPLVAPFPWWGGKRRVASLVWSRFGRVTNYVEPFAGSLAVLLGRPEVVGTETVTDKDGYVANFWRAIQHDPEQVARWATWPVNEWDLHARHRWLVDQADFQARLLSDPDFYDPKVAGWWVWGVCLWIGSGWCVPGQSDQRVLHRKLPVLSGQVGVIAVQRRLPRKRPHLSGQVGVIAARDTEAWFERLEARLRHVRVCCGEWDRILGPSVTWRRGTTTVFLDPPYGVDDRADLYGHDSRDVASRVRAWALANGDDPRLRIALCGYEGEHEMPATWECVAWKAHGGYGNQRRQGENRNAWRERIWFSPGCLQPQQLELFPSLEPVEG